MLLEIVSSGQHGERLRILLRRWSAEASALGNALAGLHAELEVAAREATWCRLRGEEPAPLLHRHVAHLQHECDEIAIELMHVRLAIQGAELELAQHAQLGAPQLQPMPA